jgi:hypothetical protein
VAQPAGGRGTILANGVAQRNPRGCDCRVVSGRLIACSGRVDKIRVRLGGEPGMASSICRPKGMHAGTVQRLADEADRLEAVDYAVMLVERIEKSSRARATMRTYDIH